MFRRKADSLPTFVSHTSHDEPPPVDDKKQQSLKSRWNLVSTPKTSHIIFFVLFCGFFLFVQQVYTSDFDFSLSAVEIGSFLSSDFEAAAEENETTMEDILKRHPYNNIIPDGGNEDLKYSSTILKTHARPKTEEDEYGNIIFFSFHGRVGSVSLLNALHQQYGYQDGGQLVLDDIHNRTTKDDEEWGHHDATENSEQWQSNIIARVQKTFTGYGARDFRRKMVHVRMIDAWTNDVSITWLIKALRDVGGVTHMVFLTRNPLRAKISDIASTRFKHIITPSITCDDQKFLYDIGRVEAIEMAVSQHSGIREALSVEGIKSIGFTYEHDISPNHLGTLGDIAAFLWDRATGRMPVPNEVDDSTYQTQIGDCALNKMIYNFKELHCTLTNTALGWMVDADGSYTFDRIMELGDEFKDWISGEKQGINSPKLINPVICRITANHQEVQDSTLAVRKHSRRCGHGGHTPVCNGYGQMKSFMCSRLLALTNGQCDSFTYSSGNCYLHDETIDDFWEGDCDSSTISFIGYLRFPDDR
jgi:hypothetical protein